MHLVGRNDIAATAFVADSEDCVQAFDYAATHAFRGGMPAQTAQHMGAIVTAAAELRGALYGLPDDIKLLIDLHLLSDGARRRVAQDLSQLIEPLEDLAGGIVEIERAAVREGEGSRGALEDRLVLALAAAYRNRLNRKPGAADDSTFPSTLSAILEFAGQRLASVSACRGAITPSRLRRLLARAP